MKSVVFGLVTLGRAARIFFLANQTDSSVLNDRTSYTCMTSITSVNISLTHTHTLCYLQRLPRDAHDRIIRQYTDTCFAATKSICTIYRVRQKKVIPAVFCKFLSNRLEFFHEILQLCSLFIWTKNCQISFNYLEI